MALYHVPEEIGNMLVQCTQVGIKYQIQKLVISQRRKFAEWWYNNHIRECPILVYVRGLNILSPYESLHTLREKRVPKRCPRPGVLLLQMVLFFHRGTLFSLISMFIEKKEYPFGTAPPPRVQLQLSVSYP